MAIPILLVTLITGIVISASLAYLTTTFTSNAEAAQMTSMPVVALALLSQSSIRGLMPENVARIMDRTPFALMSDAAQLGWAGTTVSRLSSGEPTLDFAGVFSEGTTMLIMLLVWAIVLAWCALKYMKWETNR